MNDKFYYLITIVIISLSIGQIKHPDRPDVAPRP